MPNPVVKYVIIFQSDEGYGWTETHYKPAGVLTPPLKQAYDLFEASVMTFRAVLLGHDCSIVGARISYPAPPNVASLGWRKKIAGSEGVSGAAPALSLAVNFVNTDFTKKSITHLRGFWDLVEVDETYRPDQGPGWQIAFEAWKNSLTQGGYGWLSKDPAASVKGNVLSYAILPSGLVRFTLDAPGIPTAFPGGRAQVRFSGFHNKRSILNRPLLVSWEDATHLVTLSPVGATAISSTGKFNYRATTFTQYADTGSISLGERRMGKVLNRYPGRSRAITLN